MNYAPEEEDVSWGQFVQNNALLIRVFFGVMDDGFAGTLQDCERIHLYEGLGKAGKNYRMSRV